MIGEKIINISFDSIIRECNMESDSSDRHYENLCRSNYNMIHEVFRYRKFQDDFADYLTLYEDGESILGQFRASYDEFIIKVSYFLNMEISNPRNDEEFESHARDRIKVLEGIKTIEELKKEFPALYRDFIDGRKYMDTLRTQKNYLSEEDYKERKHYYYSCALKYNLENFIERQVILYSRFVNHRKEYEERIKKQSANRYLKTHFNQDKLAMLVIAEIVRSAENTEERQEIKKYLKIIGRYISSDFDQSVEVIDSHGNKVNIEEILKRYYHLQQKLKETNQRVSWELVPEGRELFTVVTEKKSPRKTKMTKEQATHLRKIGEERTKIYESSNYLAKVIGRLQYKGYVAYIYPNGEVILDREYDPDRVSTATGNAIFNMKVADFEALSRLDKYELKKSPKVTRIVHSKNWQKRVQDIISREGTEEEQEQAKKLVMKLKKKNSK